VCNLCPVDYQLHQFPIQLTYNEYVVPNAKILKHLSLTTWASLGKVDELNNVVRLNKRNIKSNETEGFHIMTIVEYFGGHTTQVHTCDGLHYLTRAEEKTAFLKNVALFNKCAFLKHLSFDVNNPRDDRHSLSNLPFSSI
jgi:hypothetical protein